MKARVFAPAKINLTLHVTGLRADGYHALDSLVVFADIGDTVTAEPADRLSLHIDGPFAGSLVETEAGADENLVLRAARLFHGPPAQAALTLTKRLPLTSGIGGGSTDAAAALLALADLLGRPLPPPKAQWQLGADVPVCLYRRACRMRGLGEILTPSPPLPPLDVLLVNPGVAIPTPQAFRNLARKDNPGMGDLPDWPDAGAFFDWLAGQRNDLFAPAATLHPVLHDVVAALRATGAPCVGMSGSGATCYALFPRGDAATEAETAMRRAAPEWWTAAGRIGDFQAHAKIR